MEYIRPWLPRRAQVSCGMTSTMYEGGPFLNDPILDSKTFSAIPMCGVFWRKTWPVKTPYAEVQRIQVWQVRWPLFGRNERWNVLPQPLLITLGFVRQCWVLLKPPAVASEHFLGPREQLWLQHLLSKDMLVYFHLCGMKTIGEQPFSVTAAQTITCAALCRRVTLNSFSQTQSFCMLTNCSTQNVFSSENTKFGSWPQSYMWISAFDISNLIFRVTNASTLLLHGTPTRRHRHIPYSQAPVNIYLH